MEMQRLQLHQTLHAACPIGSGRAVSEVRQQVLSSKLNGTLETQTKKLNDEGFSARNPFVTMSNRASQLEIAADYHPSARATAYRGDCLHLLHKIPDKSASLVVTSPPYNIGKAYEKRRAVQAY